MAKSAKHTWFIWILLAAGIVLTVIVSIVQYVAANNRPLHPDPLQTESVMRGSPAPQWESAIKQAQTIVRKDVSDENLPGVSVAVGVGGEIVWAEGFGWTNLETRALVDPDTRFRIGHVSNTLTSAGVGLLVDQKRLRLDDEVQDYVPAFPREPWPITLRQLMGNMAGIHHYKNTEWGDKPTAHCERAADGLPAFAADPLLFEPETKYKYSTYGWVLVSAIVEAAVRQSFFQFMRASVFEPLGMSHTSVDLDKGAGSNIATPYFRANFGNATTTNADYSCFAGGGAFLSTPSDLVRFAIALGGGKFLQPDTVRRFQTEQQLTGGESTGYGLGWTVARTELGKVAVREVGHASRTIEGGSVSFLVFPDQQIVVAVMSNMSFAQLRSVAISIAEVFKNNIH